VPDHPTLPGITPAAPDDDGAADPSLIAALAAGDLDRFVQLLPQVRLLVPVVALPATGAASGEAEMAVPALVNEAGRRALPVFTCLAELVAWRDDARPVPMRGARVLAGAVAEGYDGVVVDVAGERPVTLDRTALEKITAR
jgi:hypothetical protein